MKMPDFLYILNDSSRICNYQYFLIAAPYRSHVLHRVLFVHIFYNMRRHFLNVWTAGAPGMRDFISRSSLLSCIWVMQSGFVIPPPLLLPSTRARCWHTCVLTHLAQLLTAHARCTCCHSHVLSLVEFCARHLRMRGTH